MELKFNKNIEYKVIFGKNSLCKNNQTYCLCYINDIPFGSIIMEDNYKEIGDLATYGLEYYEDIEIDTSDLKKISSEELLFSEKYVNIFKKILKDKDKIEKIYYPYMSEKLILDLFISYIEGLLKL